MKVARIFTFLLNLFGITNECSLPLELQKHLVRVLSQEYAFEPVEDDANPTIHSVLYHTRVNA